MPISTLLNYFLTSSLGYKRRRAAEKQSAVGSSNGGVAPSSSVNFCRVTCIPLELNSHLWGTHQRRPNFLAPSNPSSHFLRCSTNSRRQKLRRAIPKTKVSLHPVTTRLKWKTMQTSSHITPLTLNLSQILNQMTPVTILDDTTLSTNRPAPFTAPMRLRLRFTIAHRHHYLHRLH